MPTLPTFRFSGDGLDFRRPATTAVPLDVIDLTDDNELTHFQPQSRPGLRVNTSSSGSQRNGRRVARDFVDVDDEPTRPTIDSSSQSSDLELLEVRSVPIHQVSDGEQRRRHEIRQARRQPNLRPSDPQHPQDSPFTIGNWGALRQHAQGREAHRNPAHQSARQFHRLLHSDHLTTPTLVQGGNGAQELILPGDLDFVTQGFQMGEVAVARPVQPALPTYDAPPPPRPGFTRSPKEEDALICPNCEEELGTGADEAKRQVWVVKACGHVRRHAFSLYLPANPAPGLLWRMCQKSIT